MDLPIELQMIINAYARPMTRPDWRQGSYMIRRLRNASYDNQRGDFVLGLHTNYFMMCKPSMGKTGRYKAEKNIREKAYAINQRDIEL